MKESCRSSSAENSRLSRMMKQVEGVMTRTNSMVARRTRSFALGLKVVSSGNAALFCRCGRKMGGEPIQVLSSRNASAGLGGGVERQPMRTLSPITVSGGSRALLPMKERLPMWFQPRVMAPLRTRGAPSETLSAMKLSSPMDRRSGEMNEAVETSAP